MDDYDPFDEKRKFTLQEWVALAKSELDKYEKEWTEANDFHKGSHTWHEWWSALWLLPIIRIEI